MSVLLSTHIRPVEIGDVHLRIEFPEEPSGSKGLEVWHEHEKRAARSKDSIRFFNESVCFPASKVLDAMM